MRSLFIALTSFFLLLNGVELRAGIWKKSLDLTFKQRSLSHIVPFHLGLHDLEKRTTESRLPLKYTRSRARRDGVSCFCDNIGNCFPTPLPDLLDYDGRPVLSGLEKNTLNTALASLQLIYREAESETFKFYFLHVYRKVGGSTKSSVRSFDSLRDTLTIDSKNHLLTKSTGPLSLPLPSKPRRLDLLEYYHPFPHAEDKIFYAVNKDGANLIAQAWRNIAPPRGSRIDAIILHLHTRFDMCGNCAYALDWELASPQGFSAKIVDYVRCTINQDNKQMVDFGALVSSRQDYLVWGASRRTLPEGPPMDNGETTVELSKNYEQTIDVNILSAQRQFIQTVIPLFQVSPINNPISSYQLAWNNRGGAFPVVIPPVSTAAIVTGQSSPAI